MKKVKYILTLGLIILLTGCASSLAQEDTYSHVVNFKEMNRYAKRASLAYSTNEEIKKEYGAYSKLTIGEGEKYKLKWFVQEESYPSNKTWLVIRGTNNFSNVLSDARYLKTKDKLSGIYLHKGFYKATKEIYDDLKKVINKKSDIYISGHSLGGAAAVISMIWLKEEGYNVRFCYTFGQPKVTNSTGAKKYKDLPLIRVVNHGDPVPYVPPITVLSSLNKPYKHFGEEVILVENNDYVYLENHDASRYSVGSLWNKLNSRELDAHRMVNYLKKIQMKEEVIKEVQWTKDAASLDKLFIKVKVSS